MNDMIHFMTNQFEKDFYENYYHKVFGGDCSVSSLGYKLSHVLLEMSLKKKVFESCLEIGGGQGEHLSFVRHQFSSYLSIDFKLPAENLYIADTRVKFIEGDIKELDFNEGSFDRVILTCVLHHLDEPILVLEKIKKWLKPGGLLSIFLPSDPGILNRAVRKFFVIPRARKLGFEDYEIFAALQHKNHYWGIRTVLSHVFQDCKIHRRYFPFGVPLGNLSLLSIWRVWKPEVLKGN